MLSRDATLLDRPYDELPPPPRLGGGMPLLGHAFDLQKRPIALLLRGWREHGELFEIHVLGRRFAVLMGPQAHEAFFRAPEDQLSQREVYQFTVPMFGTGVAYDAPPALMAEQVGFLHPAVREKRLETYVRQMRGEVAACLAGWGEEGVIDLDVAMNELTVNIACRCLLGEEIRGRLYDGFARHYHDLQGGINLIGFFLPQAPIPAHLRRDRARREIGRMIGAIIAERRRHGRPAEDFLQTLMEASYSDERPLSDDEIAGILVTSLFAGQHTSAVLATWVGLELAARPAQVEPVLAEMRKVYGADATVSRAALRAQQVLERTVRETERLHPPLILLVRKVLRDMEYGGHRIAAGSMAMVSPGAAQRLPEVFADPNRFDPDRWLQPDGTDRVKPYTLISFGGGKHVCIGMHFAYMQVKLIWTCLLSRFTFVPDAPLPRPDYGRWVTGPRPPARVRYRRRSRPVAL